MLVPKAEAKEETRRTKEADMLSRVLSLWVLSLAAALSIASTNAATSTPISIYGVWHAGNDYCTWASLRNLTEFDQKNHWLIDRGDGSGRPSVNLVVLSFVHPVKLLSRTTDMQTTDGIPIGMTQE